MKEKLKSLISEDRSFFGILVIIVATASFFLGRASLGDLGVGGGQVTPRFSITQQSTTSVQNNESPPSLVGERAEMVVASKSGTRYHRLDCPGALQIKPENRIEFQSAGLARAAGYTPAGNCPGLQ